MERAISVAVYREAVDLNFQRGSLCVWRLAPFDRKSVCFVLEIAAFARGCSALDRCIGFR